MCFFRLVVATMMLSLLSYRASADLEVTERKDTLLSIRITGIIGSDDVAKFVKEDLGAFDISVELDSPGGDAESAMRIGRAIRSLEGSTIVTGQCEGSCVLIFIAGVDRINAGKIAPHRPLLSNPGTTPAAIRTGYANLLASMKQYIEELHLPTEVYALMTNTEEPKRRTFSYSEIEPLIPAREPLFLEIDLGTAARWHGVHPIEYRRRQESAKQLCMSGDNACVQAARWNLSREVYDSRIQVAKKCEPDPQAIKVPWRTLRTHPVMEATYACLRDIMSAK